MKNIKELAKELALSCYDMAKDNDSNNATTHLDFYEQGINESDLIDELMLLRNVLQVEINALNDNDISIVFASMSYPVGRYEQILYGKRGIKK